MAGFERSVVIERPVEDVWDFFLDPSRTQAWMPDIVRLDKLTEGPVAVGTLYRETRLMKGKEHTATVEITAFEERRVYAGTVDQLGIRGTYTYRFSERPLGTHVALVAEATARGVAKLMLPMVLAAMKKQDGDQLLRLKAVLEVS